MKYSWKVGFTDRDADPVAFNALRFPSVWQARMYGLDLFARWTAAKRWECHRSTDPVTHTFTREEGLKRVENIVDRLAKLEDLGERADDRLEQKYGGPV